MKIEQFLSERFDTVYKYNPWKRHFNAMFNSYCACPQGCGGMVRPGDDYYRRPHETLTIHASCAEAIYNNWRDNGVGDTAVAENPSQV